MQNNNFEWSLIFVGNSIVTDFHKNKKIKTKKSNWSVIYEKKPSLVVFTKPQKYWSNTGKKQILYNFSNNHKRMKSNTWK